MIDLKIDGTGYLLNNYGHAEMKGFMYIVWILENVAMPFNFTKIYKELSKLFKANPSSIERSMRYYKNKVGYTDMTLKEFMSMLIIKFHQEIINENS